jgi:hypothetical protein
VRVAGQQAWVASPTGRLSVVDLSQPAQPQLQASMVLPTPAFAVTGVQGLAVVAGGSHLYALDLPQPGALAAAANCRGLLRSWNYSLDVEPLGDKGLISAEFAALRTLTVHPELATKPQLVAPKTVFVRAGAVGLPMMATVDVWAAGGDVSLAAVHWREGGDVSGPPVTVGAGQTIPQGSAVALQLALPKTQKGKTTHLLELALANGAVEVLQVQETTLLQPGDPLPPLAYKDASGQLIDVHKHLQGKPGVVIVAAHTCPVALVGLAALVAQLRPLVQAGSLGAVTIDPWDKPIDAKEAEALSVPFPVLYSPLTTTDNHGYSALLQQILAQPTSSAGSIPVVYVVDHQGVIVESGAGLEPLRLRRALQSLGLTLPP